MPSLAERPLKRTWEVVGLYSSAVGGMLSSSSPHANLTHNATMLSEQKHTPAEQSKAEQRRA